MPGWGGAECHSARGIFPDRNHDTGHFDGNRTSLKRFLDASQFRRRPFPEGPVNWHNDYVLTIAPYMRHLKDRHRIHSLRSRFSHLSLTFQLQAG
jgi:hypothetical protein